MSSNDVRLEPITSRNDTATAPAARAPSPPVVNRALIGNETTRVRQVSFPRASDPSTLTALGAGDLIQRFPFRYLDRTQVYNVADLNDDLPYVQVRGMLRGKELVGEGPKQRLTAKVGDGSGELELVWFKGVKWVQQYTRNNQEYIVFGKPTMFNGRPQMAHPELEEVSENKPGQSFLQLDETFPEGAGFTLYRM